MKMILGSATVLLALLAGAPANADIVCVEMFQPGNPATLQLKQAPNGSALVLLKNETGKMLFKGGYSEKTSATRTLTSFTLLSTTGLKAKLAVSETILITRGGRGGRGGFNTCGRGSCDPLGKPTITAALSLKGQELDFDCYDNLK